MVNERLEAAIAYTELGWAVLPLYWAEDGRCSCGNSDCRSPGKHPLLNHGLKEATSDPRIIRGWWETWPDANVGIRTGAVSGIAVLDVDPEHGGAEALSALEDWHGPLPRTPRALTGGGGVHYAFKHPGAHTPVRNKVGLPVSGFEASGLDIRGDDGYIVAPPSRHVRRTQYSWADGFSPTDLDLAEIPQWLLQLARAPMVGDSPQGASADCRPIPEGKRHATLTSLAGTLRSRGASAKAIGDYLRAENRARCRPPLSDAEVISIARSAELWWPGQPALQSPDPAWDAPVPLSDAALPDFPIHAFPEAIRRFVEDEAGATQTPLDLPAMLTLSVCAAVCAKKVVVSIRPGYAEPLNLFTVTTLPPGNRKSSVFRNVCAPLEAYEREEIQRTRAEIVSASTQYEILKARLEQARRAASKAKANDRDRLVEEAKSLGRELAGMKVPVSPRYIVDDCSPERLATLLVDHGGRLALMSPEGDVFDLMGGRYSPNGIPNLGVYLKGHSGDALRVDRVNRPSEYANGPALTVALTVQPEVLRGLVNRPGFRGRGLLGRFLYSLPRSTLGSRAINPPPVSSQVQDAYERVIHALLAIPFGTDRNGEVTAHTLSLTPDASEHLRRFEAWLEPQLAELGELGHMTDWGGKLAGATARIAGVLHMVQYANRPDPWAVPIEGSTMLRAWSIAEYLLAHARAAYGEMGADAAVEAARHLLALIQRRTWADFTKRDLFQAGKGRFKKAADLDAPLALLAEHGFIRERRIQHGGPGRPPSPAYSVNPHLNAHNLSNPQNDVSKHLSEDTGDCLRTRGA